MSRRTAFAGVLVLVAGALALRVVGIGFLLPHSIAPAVLALHDEAIALQRGGDLSQRSLYGARYPHLVPRILSVTRALQPRADEEREPQTLEEHLARARAPWVRMNAIVAVLSLIAIPGTYLLARRFVERTWSVVAAAFTATSVSYLWFSQQARPDAVEASAALLAVLACLRLCRKPVATSYVLAGVGMSLAIGALQGGFATLVPFVAAVLLRDRREPRASVVWNFAVLGFVALALFAFYSFVFQHRADVGAESLGRVGLEGSRLSLLGGSTAISEFNGDGFSVVLGSLVSYDPLITVLALLGLVSAVAAAFRRAAARGERGRLVRKDAAVVAAYALPYFAWIGTYAHSTESSAIPLLPYLALLAAFGLRSIWQLASSARNLVPRAAALVILAAFLAAQSYGAARLSWIRSQPDTATQAATWIRGHVQPGKEKIVVGPALELPLYQTSRALRANEPALHTVEHVWFGYQWDLPAEVRRPAERYDLITLPLASPAARRKMRADPAAYVRSFASDWVVLANGKSSNAEDVARLSSALDTVGTRVARFVPDGDDRWRDAPIAHDIRGELPLGNWRDAWFWRAFDARCTGPVIEIWRLQR